VGITAAAGTRNISANQLNVQGNEVRNSFVQEYPGLTARWLGPTYRPLTWGALSGYAGYGSEPSYYDYGTTAVYEGDTVYVNGDSTVTPVEYATQATAIAETGQAAGAVNEEDFLTLGVFGMILGDETTAAHIFQIKLNKQGIIRGEYYDASTQQTTKISGSVDKKTQRAAWTIGGDKMPVYEVGVANLTKPETTMMVHNGTDGSQQFALVRIEQPAEGQ
jgi:hypothetical protein